MNSNPFSSSNPFGGDSDSEEETLELKTNKEYAKSYNKFREKELLKKLKDRKQNESESSSDSESSDDEPAISKEFDKEFFKTLNSLKSEDPKIYDKNTKFFDGLEDPGKKTNDGKKGKGQKALTIKDYERKVILEKGGKYEDDASDDEVMEENDRAGSPSYMEEQIKLRQELKKAVESDASDEEFGGIFKRREKTKHEKLKEEEQYAEWLAGTKEDIGEAAIALHPLKEYWSNPKLPKQEQFLRDYILSNGYQDKDIEEIPTYDEIVGDFSEDEQELEKQAEFEQKFNFRFEEPDQEFIKRYPRTIDSSVRKIDDRRKQKRVEVKERKVKEKEHKLVELQMMKEIKRKEIAEKIEKLKEVTGNEELPFKEDDLDDDFDPEAHDKRMRQIFNDEYYGVDEGEEKPECPDIEDLKVEDWDNYDPAKDNDGVGGEKYEPHCEDDEFNMDCDYDPNAAKVTLQDELIEMSKSKRKRRKRNQFMEMIKKDKPAFDPEDEITYSEYIDEYYKMDYEDMIGDTPCRFKYVETVPNDFGLTTEEILLAKNKELNQWVSLKKAVQIRPKNAELRDRNLYKMKARNEALKRKIFVSLYGPPSEDENDGQPEASPTQIDTETNVNKDIPTTSENGIGSNKQKNRKRKLNPALETITSPQNELSESVALKNTTETDTTAEEHNTSNVNKKKKKKKPKKKNVILDNRNSTESKLSENKKMNSIPEAKNSSESKTKKSSKPINHKANQFTKNKSNFKSKSKDENTISDERLKAYGINPRKFHKKQQFISRNQNKQSSKKSTNTSFKKKTKSS